MANIFDQFDVNTPTKNVTSTPNIFDKFDDNKVNDGTTVSNIPQLKNFPKSFLESAYEDVKETGSDVADFLKDVYSSSIRSFEKAEEANRMAQEKAGKIFGGATVELVTALPELISNVAKIAAPETSKEIAESPIGQAYSKVLNTINPELSKEEDIAKTILSLATGVGAGIKAGKILSDLLVKKFGRDKSQKIAVELNKLVDTKSAASVSKAVDTIPVKTTKILTPTVASSAAAIQLDVQQRKEDQQFISPLALYLNDAIGPEASDWLKENAGVDLVSVGRSLQINPNDTEAQKLIKQYKDAAALEGIAISAGTLAIGLIKSAIKPTVKAGTIIKDTIIKPTVKAGTIIKDTVTETIGKLNTAAGRPLTSKAGLPKDIYNLEIDRNFASRPVSFNTKADLVKLKNLQKKEKVSDEAFEKYWNEGVDDGLSPVFKKAADSVKDSINKNEENISKLLGLPPESKLGVRSEGQDFYITRIHRASIDKEYNESLRNILNNKKSLWAKLTGKKPDEELTGLIENVRDQLTKSGVIDKDGQDFIIATMLNNMSPRNSKFIKDIFEGTSEKFKSAFGSQTSKVLKAREDLTEPFLKLLGEVKNPYQNIQNTLLNQQKLFYEIGFWKDIENLLKQNMGKDIELGGLMSFLPKRLESIGKADAEKLVSLESQVKKSIGKFGGDNVKIGQDIFTSEYFGDMVFKGLNLYDPASRTTIGHFFRKLSAAVQAKETLVDPAAYTLNTFGGGQSLILNGHMFNPLTYPRAVKAVKTWADQFDTDKIPLVKRSPEAVRKLAFLKRRAVLDQSVTGEVIVQNAKNFKGERGSVDKLFDFAIPEKVFEKLGRAYGQPDFYTKLVAFEAEVASQKFQFPFKKWKKQQIAKGVGDNKQQFLKEEYEKFIWNKAADDVVNSMPTYGLAPPAFREFTKVPILGNYTLFATELVRTTYGSTKIAARDMLEGTATGNPRQVAAGVRRFAGLLAVTAGADYGIDKLQEYMNYDENTKKTFQMLAMPWAKGSRVIPMEPLTFDETAKEKLTRESVMKQFPREKWDELVKERGLKGTYKNFITKTLKRQRDNFKPYLRTRAGSSNSLNMFDYVKAPVRLVFAKLLNDGTISNAEMDDAFKNARKSITGPFTSPKFLTEKIMSTLVGVNPQTGKSIYDQAAGATEKEKILDGVENILGAAKGGLYKLITDYMKITPAEELLGVGRAMNRYGQPLDKQSLIMFLSTGTQFPIWNMNRRMGYDLAKDIKGIDELKNNFKKVLLDSDPKVYNTKDADKLVEKYEKLQERKRKAMLNLAEKVRIFKNVPYTRIYKDKKGNKQTDQKKIGSKKLIQFATDDFYYPLKEELIYSVINDAEQNKFIPDQVIDDNFIQTLLRKGWDKDVISKLAKKLVVSQIKFRNKKLSDEPESVSNPFAKYRTVKEYEKRE